MIELKNYMEVCVYDMLERLMKDLNCCTCDMCKLDVAAITLNSLPPKYVVTKKGQLYAKLSFLQNQFEVDIIAAVTNAVGIVSSNPRHDQPDV